MSITYKLISQLKTGFNDSHLRVRISRIWAANIFDKMTNRYDEFIGYGILLIDEEGTQIPASIGKRICGKFIPRLEEGTIYTIQMFEVRKAKTTFRVVESELAIHFLQTTIAEPTSCEGLTIPRHKFDLVPYEQLPSRMGATDKLTDLIGRLRSSTEVEMVGLRATLKRRIIHLTDPAGDQIEIALLCDKVDLVSDSDLVGIPPVMVVTSTLIKSYNGSLSICSTAATRLFRNPALTETMLFIEGPPAAAHPAELVARPVRQLTYASFVERKRTLLELVAYCDDPEEREAVFYSRARITHIHLENGWCYPSCGRHNKMVTAVDNKFSCPSCDGEPPKTWLQYRLELEVQDPESVVVFTLLDNVASKLLSISAEDLSLCTPDAMTHDTMPAQMKALLGLELLFCVKVSKFNFRTSKRSFTVLKTFPEQEIPQPPIVVPHNVDAALPSVPAGTQNPIDPPINSADSSQIPLLARIKIEGEERPPKRLREDGPSGTPTQEIEASTLVDAEPISSPTVPHNEP